MHEGNEKGTFKLMKEFVKCVKQLERIQRSLKRARQGKFRRSGFLWSRLRLRKDPALRELELRQRLNSAAIDLTTRYKGALWELFRRSGITDDLLGDALTAVWMSVQDSASTVSSYKNLPEKLWDAYAGQTDLAILALKPKLMLRAFVDEIPSCDERGALRIVAYGSGLGNRPTDRELLGLLLRAYPRLHREVLRKSKDLSVLTDGALSSSVVADMREPFPEYENWMFRS